MGPKPTAPPDSEERLYVRVSDLVVNARQTVARGVDLVQVRNKFEIGRHFVEFEQRGADRAAYGGELLKALAARLSAEFGKGFARSKIAYMRSFYLAYRQHSAIVQTASGQFRGCVTTPELRADREHQLCARGLFFLYFLAQPLTEGVTRAEA